MAKVKGKIQTDQSSPKDRFSTDSRFSVYLCRNQKSRPLGAGLIDEMAGVFSSHHPLR